MSLNPNAHFFYGIELERPENVEEVRDYLGDGDVQLFYDGESGYDVWILYMKETEVVTESSRPITKDLTAKYRWSKRLKEIMDQFSLEVVHYEDQPEGWHVAVSVY